MSAVSSGLWPVESITHPKGRRAASPMISHFMSRLGVGGFNPFFPRDRWENVQGARKKGLTADLLDACAKRLPGRQYARDSV